MILNRLSIVNYKNIAQAEVAFSEKINCFFGNNGMGKTNILDSIYYLSFCKSHIHTPDTQLIRFGEDMCVLQGFYDFEGKTEELFVRYGTSSASSSSVTKRNMISCRITSDFCL